MKLLWYATTRFHDWLSNDYAIARDLVEGVRSLGLLGEIDWHTDAAHKRIPAGRNVTLDRFLAGKTRRRDPYSFSVGGERPRPWQLSMLLTRWNSGLGQLNGYNTFSVWFESDPFEGAAGSERLVADFRRLHTADNTEFACIHPSARYVQLSALDGRYNRPLTLGPMFEGVYWANFLDAHHLAFFDQARLASLSAYRFELVPGSSLFMQVSPDIAEAASPEVEAEMFRLTDAFRAALI